MENMTPSGGGVYKSKADKVVRFCLKCSFGKHCGYCDKNFQLKDHAQNTMFHQVERDLTCFVSCRGRPINRLRSVSVSNRYLLISIGIWNIGNGIIGIG